MRNHYLYSIFVFAIVGLAAISCDRKQSSSQGLEVALASGDTNYLHRYLKEGNDINIYLEYGSAGRLRAPLIDIAIQHGQLAVVDILLKNGANPNKRDSSGATPLIWACARVKNEVSSSASLPITITLLHMGADPNLKGSSGYTPLMWASILGKKKIAEYLLDGGANINETNDEGQAALHLAKDAEIAQMLVARGARLDIRTKYGQTPADYAAKNEKFDVLAVLTNISVSPITPNQ